MATLAQQPFDDLTLPIIESPITASMPYGLLNTAQIAGFDVGQFTNTTTRFEASSIHQPPSAVGPAMLPATDMTTAPIPLKEESVVDLNDPIPPSLREHL